LNPTEYVDSSSLHRKTHTHASLFPPGKEVISAPGFWESRARHTYPGRRPRPSIRGCGTYWYPPIASRRQAKKREQRGGWIIKLTFRPPGDRRLRVLFSDYGAFCKLDVAGRSFAGILLCSKRTYLETTNRAQATLTHSKPRYCAYQSEWADMPRQRRHWVIFH
jgi:hypothetical protein